jgi:hypothetical protein
MLKRRRSNLFIHILAESRKIYHFLQRQLSCESEEFPSIQFTEGIEEEAGVVVNEKETAIEVNDREPQNKDRRHLDFWPPFFLTLALSTALIVGAFLIRWYILLKILVTC